MLSRVVQETFQEIAQVGNGHPKKNLGMKHRYSKKNYLTRILERSSEGAFMKENNNKQYFHQYLMTPTNLPCGLHHKKMLFDIAQRFSKEESASDNSIFLWTPES